MVSKMPKGNTPKSAGKVTGFPYEVTWEHLNPDWETFILDPEEFSKIEARIRVARQLGAPLELCVDEAQIHDLLHPLNLTDEARNELARALYSLAWAYLPRAFEALLGYGPEGVRGLLKTLTKAAKLLDDALSSLPPQATALLAHFPQFAIPAQDRVPEFDLSALGAEARDIARIAQQIVEDIPRQGRGRAVDQIRDQWIWLAATAIEHHTEEAIQALQSGTAGREPRLEGTEGQVLLSYLRLTSPKLCEGTIVRIIAKHRLALKGRPAS